MYIKFEISNKRLEWYKKRSIFAKWTKQNIPDALAAPHIKTFTYKVTNFSIKLLKERFV